MKYRNIADSDFEKMKMLREKHTRAEAEYFQGIKDYHDHKIVKAELDTLFENERRLYQKQSNFFDTHFGLQKI